MRRLITGVVAAILVTSPAAQAAPTEEDARRMVLRAAEVLKADGLERACNKFTDRTGEFWKENGELYVFVINFNGIWECYPPKPAAVGANLLTLKDMDGKEFVKEMVDLAKSKGEGRVAYQWKNPATQKVQSKATHLKRVGDVFVASGVYK